MSDTQIYIICGSHKNVGIKSKFNLLYLKRCQTILRNLLGLRCDSLFENSSRNSIWESNWEFEICVGFEDDLKLSKLQEERKKSWKEKEC